MHGCFAVVDLILYDIFCVVTVVADALYQMIKHLIECFTVSGPSDVSRELTQIIELKNGSSWFSNVNYLFKIVASQVTQSHFLQESLYHNLGLFSCLMRSTLVAIINIWSIISTR